MALHLRSLMLLWWAWLGRHAHQAVVKIFGRDQVLKSRLASTEDERQQVQAKFQCAQDQIEQLQAMLQEKKRKISEWRQQNHALQHTIQAEKARNTDLTVAIEQLNEKIKGFTQQHQEDEQAFENFRQAAVYFVRAYRGGSYRTRRAALNTFVTLLEDGLDMAQDEVYPKEKVGGHQESAVGLLRNFLGKLVFGHRVKHTPNH